MREAVHTTINRYQLLPPGSTVIVAVSGGPDSMALLHFLWSVRGRYQIDVCACHLHHQLRGEEADDDANYITSYCEENGIKLYQKKLDVKRYAKEQKKGTQLAARELRYRWFLELVTSIPNSQIATGHHGDDQVETMFMKMIRGSIPLQPFGIPLKRELGKGAIIRPFLYVTKAEIEAYCKEASIFPRYDSSNGSSKYTRNRIRQQLLPVVKKENANIHIHMQRQNEWETDDHLFLLQLAEEALSEITINKSEQNVTISRLAFLDVAVPLQRRMIQLILSYLCENASTITAIHIERVIRLLQSEHPSGEIQLGDSLYVHREYHVCHFLFQGKKRQERQTELLTIPGKVFMHQWIIEASITEDRDFVEQPNQIVLDLNQVVTPLIVRSRQQDDKIAGRGMEGTKKVGRLFIDRKTPKREREKWPIIVDGSGQILWVPFLHRTRISNAGPATKKKLVLACWKDDKMF